VFGPEFIAQLQARRAQVADIRAQAEARKAAALDVRAEAKRRRFTDDEAVVYHGAVAEIRQASIELAELDERITEAQSEMRRAGYGNPTVERIRNAAGGGGGGSSASLLAFDQSQLRAMHAAILANQPYRIESRAPAAIDSLYPPALAPWVVGPQHDNRILSRLPVMATEAPAVEYVRHNSTSGSAAIVAETAAKPELTLSTDKVILPMKKLAAHTGTGWESLQDWVAWDGYVRGELSRSVIDAENAELLNGDNTSSHLQGFTTVSGALTHDATGDGTPLDSLELAIAALRNGAALADPDLLVLNPLTWSAIRRTKDLQDRYLTQPDPTVGEANSAWGVPVLVTTQLAAGSGVLVDTRKFGRVWMREPLSVRVGYTNDDFTKNIVRFVSEERLNLAIERPAAVCVVSGLPTS